MVLELASYLTTRVTDECQTLHFFVNCVVDSQATSIQTGRIFMQTKKLCDFKQMDNERCHFLVWQLLIEKTS